MVRACVIVSGCSSLWWRAICASELFVRRARVRETGVRRYRSDRHADPPYESRRNGCPTTGALGRSGTLRGRFAQQEKGTTRMSIDESIAQRMETLDWVRIEHDLDELGYAVTPRLLRADEC